jgi:hypothetical protein
VVAWAVWAASSQNLISESWKRPGAKRPGSFFV